MLKILLLIILFVPATHAFAVNVSNHAAPQSQQTPEQVIREFYRWYIHALNQNQDPLKQRQTFNKFVTARRAQKIRRAIKANEYDADYFISAQDWDKDWEKNITVTAIKSARERPAFNVILNGTSMPNYKLKVTLRKEAGVWKIDEVEGLTT